VCVRARSVLWAATSAPGLRAGTETRRGRHICAGTRCCRLLLPLPGRCGGRGPAALLSATPRPGGPVPSAQPGHRSSAHSYVRRLTCAVAHCRCVLRRLRPNDRIARGRSSAAAAWQCYLFEVHAASMGVIGRQQRLNPLAQKLRRAAPHAPWVRACVRLHAACVRACACVHAPCACVCVFTARVRTHVCTSARTCAESRAAVAAKARRGRSISSRSSRHA
jgi:hypothetical protein